MFHMMGDGPITEHALELLREIDYLAIVAVELSPQNYKEASRRIAYIMHNSENFFYDYSQRLDNEGNKLYCSEMIYAVLDGMVDDPDFEAREILGRKAFAPDQILKIGKVVYTNHPDLVNIVGK